MPLLVQADTISKINEPNVVPLWQMSLYQFELYALDRPRVVVLDEDC